MRVFFFLCNVMAHRIAFQLNRMMRRNGSASECDTFNENFHFVLCKRKKKEQIKTKNETFMQRL